MSLDPTVAGLQQEIQRAREALIDTSSKDPDYWWSPRELKTASKNGWSYSATGLALNDLIEDGTFDIQKDKLRIKK